LLITCTKHKIKVEVFIYLLVASFGTFLELIQVSRKMEYFWTMYFGYFRKTIWFLWICYALCLISSKCHFCIRMYSFLNKNGNGTLSMW
jgi:hypothetical protein